MSRFLIGCILVFSLIMYVGGSAGADDPGVDQDLQLLYIPYIVHQEPPGHLVWIEDSGAWSLLHTGNTLQAAREPENLDDVFVALSHYANVSMNVAPNNAQSYYAIGRSYYEFDLRPLLHQMPGIDVEIYSVSLMVWASSAFPPELAGLDLYIYEGIWDDNQKRTQASWDTVGDLVAVHQVIDNEAAFIINLPLFSGRPMPETIKLVLKVDEQTAYSQVSFNAIVRTGNGLEIPPEHLARLRIVVNYSGE